MIHKLIKIKSIINTLALVLLIIAIESFRHATELPFTVIDILILPLSIISIVFGLKSLFINRKKTNLPEPIEQSLLKQSVHIFTAILVLLLGLWALYEGWNNPLLMYTGVKGAAHGYTLLSIGLLLSGYSIYYILKSTISLNKRGGNK